MTREQLKVIGWGGALVASAVMWFVVIVTVTAIVSAIADLVQ